MEERRRDLVERSLKFSDELLDFIEIEQRRRRIPGRVLDQLLRAGTSVGAHNAEAEFAITRAHLLALRDRALQEASEAQYWLRVIQRRRNTHSKLAVESLLSQVTELVAILTTCVNKLRGP